MDQCWFNWQRINGECLATHKLSNQEGSDQINNQMGGKAEVACVFIVDRPVNIQQAEGPL